MDLCLVFVNLTKAFDSVSRTGLWKVLAHVGYPEKLVNIIRSFHDNIMAHVVDGGQESAAFVSRMVSYRDVYLHLCFSGL